MGKSRRSRSRRTRKRRGSGGLVTCMAKCRDDAAKSGAVAGEMKSAIKGIAAKPLGQQMSALQKYKAAAEKQKTVASKGLSDAKATIAKAKEQAKKIIKKTEKQIQIEKDKAIADIKQEVVNLSLSVAKKLINKNLNDADNKSLIEETLKKVNKYEA